MNAADDDMMTDTADGAFSVGRSRRAGPLWRACLTIAVALALVALAAAERPAAAASGVWQSERLAPGAYMDARLVSAVNAVGDLQTVPVGLHVRLPDGWKTYWRSPGEAGVPPATDWHAATNVAEAALSYPAPHRFTLFGIDTFGYEREVVFPIALRPEETGQATTLAGTVDILTCSDICVPAQFDLTLALPAGPAVPDAAAANLINRFATLVPGTGDAAGLAIDTATVTAGEPPVLRLTATAREPFGQPDILVEAGDGWSFAAPVIDRQGDGTRLTAEIEVTDRPREAPPLAGLPVTMTLIDGARAVEQGMVLAAAPASGSGFATLAGILGLAVLGGLILNLMPCVLPVLSLKLLSLVGRGGEAPGSVRLGFLATSAGIVASFLVLAAGVIALQASGQAVGWGIQFQQPLFLVFMIVLLTVFACNLLGWFEVLLPTRVADTATGVLGRTGGHSLGGQFATGAFATLLATPCSAPFLGTAVGFALARGAGEVLLVFVALGIGLALPYLVVAAVPKLATRLPRPGRWMVVLKKLLSLALAATALWLLTVLAVQVSALAAYVVGGLMVALVLLLWGRRHLGRPARRAAVALALGVALAAFVVPPQFSRPAGAVEAAGATDWVAFDRATIDTLVADGHVVFVDVTADWCLTCRANKALVIDRGEVAALLDSDGIVAVQADWTLPDDRISDFLASYGRYGIPFNIVYGPQAPSGVPLPELLTTGIVLDAIARAGG